MKLKNMSPKKRDSNYFSVFRNIPHGLASL
jgi:hypothetical protein